MSSHAVTKRVVALAFADEVLEEPELLEAYSHAVSAADDVTLVLYAPPSGHRGLEPALLALAHSAGLDADDAADVLLLAPEGGSHDERELVARVDCIYSNGRHASRFGGLPVVDAARVGVLAALAAEHAPGRPNAVPPAALEALARDPATGVLLSPWSGPEAGYADGGERYVADVIAAARDRGIFSPELRAGVRDWPSLYHLSPYRSALYDCLGLAAPVDVLELGAGCGATTRWLAERGHRVVAVEGSRARAAVARARCDGLGTVAVVAGNFCDLDLRARFDAVTLVGVLEYSHLYSPRHPGRPELAAAETLSLAFEALRGSGVVVVAIENRFGLKYWAGAREDHTGRRYDSVEGYPVSDTPTAFGLRRLQALLADAGFGAVDVFLPFPDYKLPRAIVNAAADASALALHNWVETPFPDHGRTDRAVAFNERLALRELAREGLLAELANSFLLVGYRGDPAAVRERLGLETDWAARYYSLDRAPGLAKRLTLVDGHVGPHLTAEPLGGPPPPLDPTLVHDPAATPFVRGDLLLFRVLEAGRRADAGARLAELSDRLADWLVAAFGTGETDPAGVPTLSGRAVDAVWWNVVEDDRGDWHLVDTEWGLAGPVPADLVLWRGVRHLAHRLGEPDDGAGAVVAHLEAALRRRYPAAADPERIALFEDVEAAFQEAVGAGAFAAAGAVAGDAVSPAADAAAAAPESAGELL